MRGPGRRGRVAESRWVNRGGFKLAVRFDETYEIPGCDKFNGNHCARALPNQREEKPLSRHAGPIDCSGDWELVPPLAPSTGKSVSATALA
jgi:hypothetical protein